jgi:putative ABC transport system permease protein
LINIAGLTVGLGLTILLLSFIRYELSYEEFNTKKDRIYRSVSRVNFSENKAINAPVTTGLTYDWAVEEVPAVEAVLRMDPRPATIEYQDNLFRNGYGYYADSTFFKFFDLNLKYGNKQDALDDRGIVLSEKLANRIFNQENPLGKTVHWRGYDLEVTGVLEKLPKNTHLRIDFLVSFSVVSDMNTYFKRRGISTYVYYLLKEEANTSANIKKLDSFLEAEINDFFSDYGMKVDHRLQNLGDIHLHSEDMQYNISTPGSMNTIIILIVLAFFILLIAIINYVNLETSRAETRSLEVGIRKVNGARRHDLVSQFIGESLITVMISFLLAIGFAELFSNGFENLVNREFSNELYTPLNIVIYFGLALFVGLIAGSYPALFLSSFRPAAILKSASGKRKGSSGLRVALVVVQFTIASFLVIGLLMVYSQIQYAKNKDLGFDEDQVLVIQNLTGKLENNYSLIKNKLVSVPAVEEITASTGYPGRASMHNTIRTSLDKEGMMAKDNVVKNNYDKTLGLKILEGRYFSDEFTADSNAYVLNERAVDMLGLENPVGKRIYHNQDEGRIIGVMRNYHVENIREEIAPVIHSKRFDNFNVVLVKLSTDNLQQTLNSIKQRLENIDDDYVFNYQFLDDYFDAMYKQEERMNKTSVYSAAIAIIISLMGLYALTSFVVITRRKEIGIRKAMGATERTVIFKLIKDINKWVLLANLISWPLAYYFIKQWLANFAFHIEISVWYFLAGTILTFLIALIVVVIQAYIAATENPAHTLRDE